MKRTRVKICGITRNEDAQLAVAAGADALGFVFYEPSPRYISPADAVDLVSELPAFVTSTALFVNADRALIEQVIADVRVDLLQFHGDEAADYCESFNRPYIKALRMKPGLDLYQACEQYRSAQAILLDAYRPGVPGGTGEVFDWALIPADLPLPVILAGGLDVGNVVQAIEQVSPYAIDVSGGVELSKGIKSADKIDSFMNEVTRANTNRS